MLDALFNISCSADTLSGDSAACASPLAAVLVAGLALAHSFGVFPDQLASLSLHTMRAVWHAVGAIFNMGTLGTLVRALQVGMMMGMFIF